MYGILVLKTRQLEEAPSEIQLSPLGEFKDSQGRPFRVTEEDVAMIIRNAAGKVNDAVIDYEHQTLAGSQAPAAGWVKEYIDKGMDGLWGIVDWTGRATEYLKNREYRYLSPVLLAQKKDADGFWRPSIFHSAGLTNTPQIDGMVPIVNKFEPQNKEEGHMLEKLIQALKLSADATEEDVLKAIEELQRKAEESEPAALANKGAIPKDIIDALGLQDGASVSEAKATIFAMKQTGNQVNPEEFRKLKEDLAKRNRDELVALAMKDGKITAAQKGWAETYALTDPEGFKVFVNKAPVVVPMDKMPGGEEQRKEGELEEAQKLVNKALGVSDEAFKKHNAGN